MRFPKYLVKKRALPSGGLWLEVVILLTVVVGAALHLDPHGSWGWFALCAVLPTLWVAGIGYLIHDLRRCRRGVGIYNWRLTLSRILAITNGFVVIRVLAMVILLES